LLVTSLDDRFCRSTIDLKKIIITESQKKILANHADNEKPNESCAILFGTINEQKTIVQEIFLTKNIEESPVNFTISNEQLITAYKTAEEKKMEVIGIFHSQPNSEAYPSNTDKKFMHSNPVVWVIYSGISNNFRAYMLESDILEVMIES
jgi:[CysO sulfur-carrier protein]-S-L-cysteine hydrolase